MTTKAKLTRKDTDAYPKFIFEVMDTITVYEVSSINGRNIGKLNAMFNSSRDVEIYLTLEPITEYPADELRIGVSLTPDETSHDAIAYCLMRKCEDSTRDKLTSTFSDNIDKGEDYREVHPDGRLARGMQHGIAYQEVLDDNGETTFIVCASAGATVIGMYFSDDCYAVVNTAENSGQGAIIDSQNKTAFYNELCTPASEDIDTAIIAEAFSEQDCPRWGMSW